MLAPYTFNLLSPGAMSGQWSFLRPRGSGRSEAAGKLSSERAAGSTHLTACTPSPGYIYIPL